jgi:hypothetical protein
MTTIDTERTDSDNETHDRICADCGELFWLVARERLFFVDRGLVLPRRCKSCRARRKAEKARAAAEAS